MADDEDESWGSILAAPYAHLPHHDSEEPCIGAELYLLGLQLGMMVDLIEDRLKLLEIPLDGMRSWPTQHEIAAMLQQSGWTCCNRARREAIAALAAARKAR